MLVGFILSVLVSFATTALYVGLLWWLDRHEKEPLGLAMAAFLWGAIPAILASAVAELLLDVPLASLSGGLAYEVVSNSLIAPAVEEAVKAVALLGIFVFWWHEFDNVLDGIIYGALVGFGFAVTEDLFYSLGGLSGSGWREWRVVLLMRTVLFGLNHSFFTALTGIGFGYARLARERWKRWLAPLLGLGAAITFHAIHNLGTSLAEASCLPVLFSLAADWGGVFVVVTIALVIARREKQCIAIELRDEVASGLLSGQEYELLKSYRRRLVTRWRALQAGNWRAWRRWGRLFHLGTELAFKRHQFRALGDEKGSPKAIANLRKEITALRRKMGLDVGSDFCASCGTPLPASNGACPRCGAAAETT